MVPLSCGTNNTVGLAVYETGNATFTTICAFAEYSPPWVRVGNGADPDERSGSFTENRQNWKRCPDAG